MELRSDEEYTPNRGGSPSRTESVWRVWYSPDRVRVDATRAWFDGRPSRIVQCRNYDGKGTHLNYNDGADGLAPFVKLRKVPHPSMVKDDHIFDPRALGFNFTRLYNYGARDRLDFFIGSKSIVEPNLSAVKHEGRSAYCLKWKRYAALEDEIVVRQDMNWAPVRVWSTGVGSLVGVGGGITANYTQYPDGTWFVKDYLFDQVINEEGTRIKERVVVSDAWFNRPIPDEVFTFEGIGVVAGTPIVNFDEKSRYNSTYLGNGQVAPPGFRSAAADVPSKPLAPLPGRVNYWLIAACGLLAAIDAALFYRFARARRS